MIRLHGDLKLGKLFHCDLKVCLHFFPSFVVIFLAIFTHTVQPVLSKHLRDNQNPLADRPGFKIFVKKSLTLAFGFFVKNSHTKNHTPTPTLEKKIIYIFFL